MKFRPSLVFPPLVLSLLLGGALQAVELPTLRFDMGTESSPVAAGARRVTPGTAYTLQRGYGWTSGSLEAKDAERPPVNPAWRGPGGQVIPRDFILYKEHDDVTRDAFLRFCSVENFEERWRDNHLVDREILNYMRRRYPAG